MFFDAHWMVVRLYPSANSVRLRILSGVPICACTRFFLSAHAVRRPIESVRQLQPKCQVARG